MFTEHVDQRGWLSDIGVGYRSAFIAQDSRVDAISKVTLVVEVRADPVVSNGLVRFELYK